MRIRRSWFVLGMLLLPAAVRADDHRADFYGAFSWAHGSSLLGFHESYSLLIPQVTSKDLSWVIGDLGLNFGSRDGSDVTKVTALTGPRLSLGLRQNKKNVLFGHALVGVAHTNDGDTDPTDFAVALGGGWEYLPKRESTEPYKPGESPRPLKPLWGLRVQVDYVFRNGDTDGFARVSAGLIYRFYK
jgi:hypothetical protein